MMNIQIKPLIVGTILLLFTISCGTEPKADSNESKLSETEESVIEAGADESMTIANLFDNMADLEGKTVQITGTCTKINNGIMGRNWIHLKDGSKDSYDFVVTSDVQVNEGSVVSMTGVVAINKDFGAGYKYELILEEGKLVQ